MPADSQRKFVTQLKASKLAMKAPSLTFQSFRRYFGNTLILSASDAVYAATALMDLSRKDALNIVMSLALPSAVLEADPDFYMPLDALTR
jgi:hypothetical protein